MRPEDWNGDPECPKCGGRGVVSVDYMGFPGGATQPCDCQYAYEVRRNVERVWKGLFKARRINSSPLINLDNRNLIVTASQPDFRRHLRHVAIRKGPQWDARVVSDAALAQAWLATKVEVFDADVLAERDRRKVVSEDFVTLVDIAVPFDLLIIQLGVKAAKNREMPGVLLEVLHERGHRDLPTWLVESPAYPLREGHICYDPRVGDLIDDWEEVVLSNEDPGAESPYDYDQGGVQRFSMGSNRLRPPETTSDSGGYREDQERESGDTVVVPEEKPKPRPKKQKPPPPPPPPPEELEEGEDDAWMDGLKLTKDETEAEKRQQKWARQYRKGGRA